MSPSRVHVLSFAHYFQAPATQAELRLSCHHHVNDSSRSRHATKSLCYRLDALTKTLTKSLQSRTGLLLISLIEV